MKNMLPDANKIEVCCGLHLGPKRRLTFSKLVPDRMKMRLALCLLLAACAVWLHGAPSAVPPDKQAFSAAQRIQDPAARLEALKAFLKKFPKSPRVEHVNGIILEILAKNFPDGSDELKQQVKVVLKRAHGDVFAYNNVADTLAQGNALLDEAQRLAQKSVDKFREKKFVASERNEYRQAHMKVPDEAEMHKDFLREQSDLLSTLGAIEVKRDEISEGETHLKSAYNENPDNSQAAAYLGELAAKRNKDDEALTYLTRARLTGKLEKSQEELLKSLYAKTHSGSDTGLDEYLDQAYAKLFPPPFEPAKYKAPASSPRRTVLAELFTGSGCAPCAGADLAMDGELERYGRQQFAMLTFDEHIPEPDPLTCPDGVKRFDFYDAKGTPTLALNGTTKLIGGSRTMAKQRFDEIDGLIQKALQSGPEANIELTATRDGNVIKAHAAADNIKGDWKDLRLQIALVENDLRYSGENGIRLHPMVVRNLAADGQGFVIKPGEKRTFEYTFDTAQISRELKTYLDSYEKSNDRYGPITFIQEMNSIDPKNVSVVAFVQDNDTKHVLQAAFASAATEQ